MTTNRTETYPCRVSTSRPVGWHHFETQRDHNRRELAERFANQCQTRAGAINELAALLDEEGDIAYASASKIGFTVTPGEAVYVPPRQLSFAPGGVVKARAERGSWDIWFLTTCNGVRSWQSTDGWWTSADKLNEWELIHDEGATQ